ncbi:MAG: hypothetical protein AAF830_15985 [Pseudomonadota bacterium]
MIDGVEVGAIEAGGEVTIKAPDRPMAIRVAFWRSLGRSNRVVLDPSVEHHRLVVRSAFIAQYMSAPIALGSLFASFYLGEAIEGLGVPVLSDSSTLALTVPFLALVGVPFLLLKDGLLKFAFGHALVIPIFMAVIVTQTAVGPWLAGRLPFEIPSLAWPVLMLATATVAINVIPAATQLLFRDTKAPR